MLEKVIFEVVEVVVLITPVVGGFDEVELEVTEGAGEVAGGVVDALTGIVDREDSMDCVEGPA